MCEGDRFDKTPQTTCKLGTDKGNAVFMGVRGAAVAGNEVRMFCCLQKERVAFSRRQGELKTGCS